MKRRKLFNFIVTHHSKIYFGFFFILLMGSYLSTFAIANPYNPGATLDPSCSPGDTNCYVSYDLTYFKQDGNSFSSTATLGTNDAQSLVLETNNTERMRILSTGLVGIGTSTPATELTVVSTSSSDPRGIMSAQYSTDTNGARLHFRKARGSQASPTTIVTGDTLGRLRFSGYDGTSYLQMASIDAVSTGTIATNRVPTYLAFSTATDASPSVLTERMRIFPSGGVAIGTTTDSGYKLDITGGQSNFITTTYYTAVNTGWTANFATNQATGNYGVRIGADSAAGIIQTVQSTSPISLKIEPFGGNVLIGTTSSKVSIGNITPQTTLHIDSGSADTAQFAIQGGAASLSEAFVIGHSEAGSTTSFLGNTYNNNAARFDIRMKGTASANAVMTFLGSGNVGIGTTNPTNKLQLVAGTLTDGQNALSVTATMPATMASFNSSVNIQTTTVTANNNSYGISSKMLAGSTDAFLHAGGFFWTNVAGTATSLFTGGNIGVIGQSDATTTGTNTGTQGWVSNGNINVGVGGYAIVAKNSATNIGVAGFGLNTGTSPIQIGGYFGLQNSNPTFVSAALITDNGATTSPIFLARDNGTTTFTIDDGGTVTSTAKIIAGNTGVGSLLGTGLFYARSTSQSGGTALLSPDDNSGLFLQVFNSGAADYRLKVGAISGFSGGYIFSDNTGGDRAIQTGGMLSSGVISAANNINLSGSNRFIQFWESGISKRFVIAHDNNAGGGDLMFRGGDATSSTTGTQAMRIFNSTQNVLIGTSTTDAGYKLQVGSSAVSGIVARFENSTGTCDINPTTTSLACSSDRNLKKNITSLDASILDKVLNLNPVTYNWNTEQDGAPLHNGFIAQEVESLFPDLVFTDAHSGLKSLNYMGLIPYTIKALQEMNLKVKMLPEFSDASLVAKITDFLKGIAERGEALVDSVKTNKVQTQELCVGDDQDQVCVTKDQLRTLLNGQTSSSGGQSNNQPQTPDQQDEGTDGQSIEEQPPTEPETPLPAEEIPAPEENTPVI